MPPSSRVVVSGVGKSGHVAQKLAASLSSTGTPAFFMHSYEALHGDMGGVVPGDVAILVSYSGATAEVLRAARGFKEHGARCIALTASHSTPLAAACDVHTRIAPTASAIATLALGDALAVVLSERRGFCMAQFARSHPGGVLGQRAEGRCSEAGPSRPEAGPSSLPEAGLSHNEAGLSLRPEAGPTKFPEAGPSKTPEGTEAGSSGTEAGPSVRPEAGTEAGPCHSEAGPSSRTEAGDGGVRAPVAIRKKSVECA
ncbi:hypothetical protein T484DRAFT_1968640 [Baffinella frigidus]|nr:hypothetical protein T484DRAFT_1968640 [Cryptophyta sp. CCMP2293]